MKKGFTLVELLAVIVLIGLLSLIAIPIVDKLIKDSEEQLYQTQIDNIEAAARNYYADNIFDLPENIGEYIDKTICELENLGFLDVDIKNPKTEELFYKDSYVRITKTNYGFEYKYIEDSGSSYSCSICVAVNEETKTTGNIPTGEYKIGDEYICEVKNGTKYNFFVLSTENEKINLIMDSNISADGEAIKSSSIIQKYSSSEYNKWHTAWLSQKDYEIISGKEFDDTDNKHGPITALKFVEKVTSSWDNILNLNETYVDEGGNYGKIKLNGKARLPKRSEIDNLFVEDAYNMDNFRVDKLPIWATNYLYNVEDERSISSGGYVNGRTHIDRLGSYWLLSSKSGPFMAAYEVGYDNGGIGASVAYADDGHINDFGQRNGVRPVISVYKDDFAN